MTLLSRHRILDNSPGGLRPSTLPLVCWGSPQYLRLMTLRSLGSKFHHLRASCNLPAKVGDVLSCFWSVTLMEQQSSTKEFGLGPCPFHMGKKPCRTVTALGISLSAQRQHGNIKHWSVPLLHQHMCLTFFRKFHHVAYQGYSSLIAMYKTVFFSNHVDVVSMT